MHTPKSILLHLDGSSRCIERVRVARQLAETFDAEVTGLYCVTPALMRYPVAAPASALIAGDFATLDQEERERAQAAFREACVGSPSMSWAALTSTAPWDFARRAMYADLMVMGQRDPADPKSDETPQGFVSTTLFDSGRPALVLPYAGPIEPIGRTVLIAWKETREAARAVTAALPWLRRANRVHVICYDEHPDASLQAVQAHLRRHGVSTTLHHGAQDHGNAGELLLSEASDLGADLLVMGCYGHSRAREWALGGVTRTIIESMTLPVLMSH